MAGAKRKRNVPQPTLQLEPEVMEVYKHLQPRNIRQAICENEERAKRIDRANDRQIFGPRPHETMMSRAVITLEDIHKRMGEAAQPKKQRQPGSGRKSIYGSEKQAQILATYQELKATRPDIMQKPACRSRSPPRS